VSDVPTGSDPESAPGPSAVGRRIANQAILVTVVLYVGYGLIGLLPIPPDLRYLGLVAAFYFLPAWILRNDPQRQVRYQVGPRGGVPPFSWRGAKWAAIAVAIVFPVFVLGFLWFYSRVCAGDTAVLGPVLWLESLTPWAGGLEGFLGGLCRGYDGTFFPAQLVWPESWREYGGLGALLAVAVEVFAIALPEEVFHRGYLMSALSERWAPKRRVFGVPFGLAAVLASLMFAVGHLVGMAQVARLATFFPSLVFSWLWRGSGSLWAPALFHAGSNLMMAVLLASTFPG